MNSGNITSRSLLGILYGGVNFVLTFFQSLLLVPFILDFWTKENYGIWLACYAFITLMRTIDAGHQTYIGNEFMKAYNENIARAKIILGSSIKIALFLGFLEVLIFLSVILLEKENLLIGISTDSRLNIGIFCMLVSWWIIGSAAGVLVKCFLPVGLFNRTIFWSIIYKLIEIALLIIAVTKGWEIWYILCVLSIVFFLYCAIALYDIKTKIPSIYPWWQYGSFKQGFKGFITSLMLTFNGLIEQISSNGLLILIGNFASTAAIPVFTTLRTASNVFLQITQITINPLVPDMVRFHTANEKHKIASIFNINWFLLNFFLIFPLILVVPFLQELYELWTRDKLVFDKLLSYSLMMSIVITAYGRACITYLSSINHFPSLLATNVVRGFFLLPLAYFLMRFYGISYLGLAICISEFFSSILLPIFFAKRLLKTELNLKGIASFLMSCWFLLVFLIVDYFEILTVAQFYLISLSIFTLMVFYQWRNNIDETIKKYTLQLVSTITSKFKS